MSGFRAIGRQIRLNRFPEEAAMSRLLPIILIGAVAAGCTPGRIDRVRVESGYDPVQYQFVPYTRAMHADVSGNPFGMDQQAFNTLVSDTIQPPGVQPSDGSPYRVHLAFNGSTSVNRDLACQASGGGASHGDMTLVAALCPGDGPALTFLTGSVSDVSGPDDPRFHQFVRSSVVKLFPGPTIDNRNQMDHCFLPMC
ncbi:MAG TPA: hypothetical protein VGF43_12765 [Dongiaceae bacterium]